MLKEALVGASFVPLIIGANYLLRERYTAEALHEAEIAVRAATPGRFSGAAFPKRSDLLARAPPPFKICGYADGRRFLYDSRTRQFEIDAEPGDLCDQRYYPPPAKSP
jgi:hypothetical protein